MEDHIGKTCPFCKTEIKEGDELVVCPVCGIPHHADCWNENGGCTTFGCSGKAAPAAGDLCTRCGAPMAPDQLFCPKCGAPKSVPQKNVCSRCGTELRDDQVFCPRCGQSATISETPTVSSAIEQFNANVAQQEDKKKKKKTGLILAVAAVAVALIAVIAFFGIKAASEEPFKELKAAMLAEEISADEVQKCYDDMPFMSALLYKGELEELLEDAVAANPFNTSVFIVDPEMIELYKCFKEIADDIGLSDDEKVVEYIDAVLELEPYAKYYDVSVLVLGTADGYYDAMDYISDAADSSSYTMKLYVGYAKASMGAAYEVAKEHSTDELTEQYVEGLRIMYYWLSDVYDGYDPDEDFKTGQNMVTDIIDLVLEKCDEVKGIRADFPTFS